MFEFVLLSLASWRLTKMLTQEEGPYMIFRRFREYMLKFENWNPLSCFWCASVWVSFLFAFLFMSHNFVVGWLSISASVIILDHIFFGGND